MTQPTQPTFRRPLGATDDAAKTYRAPFPTATYSNDATAYALYAVDNRKRMLAWAAQTLGADIDAASEREARDLAVQRAAIELGRPLNFNEKLLLQSATRDHWIARRAICGRATGANR